MDTPATLLIYGDIGESIPGSIFDDPVGNISAKMVSEFLDQNKAAKQIIVRINSRGGDCQEGYTIYDLLTTSGKKIKTVGEGKIYSIATIIFLAGSEREMMANADGLIHNPFIPPYTLADAYGSEDLTKIAESLQQEEAKMLEFYAEKTGTSSTKLAEYMKEETKLSAQDMLDLGFATKILQPVKAFAFINPNKKFNMTPDSEKAFFEKLGTTLDNAIAKIAGFSRLSIKSQLLTDKDGKELTLDKETGVPAVGDKASPDGVFLMADGNTITVSGGVITTIVPSDPAMMDKEALEAAKQKVAELEGKVTAAEAKVAEAEAKVTEAEEAKVALKNAEVEAVALVAELRALKNAWKPEARKTVNTKTKVEASGVDLSRVRDLVNKNNKVIEPKE